MIQAATLRHRIENTQREVVMIRMLLSLLSDQISQLKPGVNTTDRVYKELESEYRGLTVRLITCMLYLNGDSEDEGIFYNCGGGIVVRLRAYDSRIFRLPC